jgi:Ferritin-like domain
MPGGRVGRTRREMLRAAGLGGAFAVALSSGGPARAASDGPQTDAELVYDLLQTEQVMAFAYEQLLSTGVIAPGIAQMLTHFSGHEQQHVRAWTGALRRLGAGAPVAPVSVDAADAALKKLHVAARLADAGTERRAIELLIGAEEANIGAYYTAIAKLHDPQLLQTAAQAMGADSQHAMALRRILHPRPVDRFVPNAFVQGSHR